MRAAALPSPSPREMHSVAHPGTIKSMGRKVQNFDQVNFPDSGRRCFGLPGTYLYVDELERKGWQQFKEDGTEKYWWWHEL